MNLVSLILYGLLNIAMVASHLRGKGLFYQFPFWAGILAVGWFFPQAIGGYLNVSDFPRNAYSDGMLFATLCTAGLWISFSMAVSRTPLKPSWLDAPFDARRLYWAGAALCLFGFFFQWKLWMLPEEMLAQTQWSGATVKYLFFASVFKFGFIALWLLYLSRRRLFAPRLLVFVVPSLFLLLSAAVLRGRRSEMMNLVAYVFVSLWFVRRITIPRWVMVSGLAMGLLLVNGIGTYRAIMKKKEVSLGDRLTQAANADYVAKLKGSTDRSGSEFRNYMFYRQVYAESGYMDFGGIHWNKLIFNYVPAQLVGRELKDSLMLKELEENNPEYMAEEKYGHRHKTGSTTTGYSDAFGSFGWLGFIKFMFIGWMMGVLYRHAMKGGFFAQLLYVYSLGTAMHAVSHGTHRMLVSVWIYFFMLGFPALYWARFRRSGNEEIQGPATPIQSNSYG